jgi:mRNA interferase RelE/StbE
VKTVRYSREAAKALARMPRNFAANIRAKMTQYAIDPASLANNVKALSGQPGFLRLRVGDWWVVFREDGTVISVARIAPRGSAYD